MNKSQRINDMLIFLNKKRQFNLKDIMNRYHISKSTALRDIASLETLGIPIYIDLQKLKEKFENSISEQQLSKITKIEKILQPEVRKTINNSQLRIILDILLHRQGEFFPIKYEQQSLQVQFIKLFSYKGDWYVEVLNKDTSQKEELSCQSIEFYP